MIVYIHIYIYIHTVYVYRYERVQKCWIPQICLMENKMISHENLGYPLEIPANFSPKVILEWQPADRHYPGEVFFIIQVDQDLAAGHVSVDVWYPHTEILHLKTAIFCLPR